MKLRTAFSLSAALALAGVSSAATLRVPSQHASIQGAINAASAGDTILISPGTYAGEVTCSKSGLTLKGRGKVVLTSGTGTGLNILLCSFVTVQNLRIQDAQIVVSNSSFSTIRKCRARGGSYGIWVVDSVGISVIKCRFEDTTSSPIRVNNSDDCLISGNKTFQGTGLSGNFIRGNMNSVEGNRFSGGNTGLFISIGSDVLVIGNQIEGADHTGIDTSSAWNVTVSDNRVRGGEDGIVYGGNSHASLDRNRIQRVSRYGIDIGSAWYVVVTDNSVKKAGSSGIHTNASASIFYRNDLRKCRSFGFYIGGDDNTFTSNRARTLAGGVDIYKSTLATGNRFVSNDYVTSNL